MHIELINFRSFLDLINIKGTKDALPYSKHDYFKKLLILYKVFIMSNVEHSFFFLKSNQKEYI